MEKPILDQLALRFLPFLKGKYSTAPGLSALPNQSGGDPRHRSLFQFDRDFPTYWANKVACREEDIQKYYREKDLFPATKARVNAFLAQRLLIEYPAYFQQVSEGGLRWLQCQLSGERLPLPGENGSLPSPYVSLFDALCCQVQEDVAVWQLDGERDWLAAVHLCAPNHWAADQKIGRNFDAVHQPVAGMERLRKHYRPMLQGIVGKEGPFTRFAWGIATDNRLNHHPEPPAGLAAAHWHGRDFDPQNPTLCVRVERQNLVGFPEQQAFLFTIRTYFVDVATLSANELLSLKGALLSMDAESLQYKGLDKSLRNIVAWIEGLMG